MSGSAIQMEIVPSAEIYGEMVQACFAACEGGEVADVEGIKSALNDYRIYLYEEGLGSVLPQGLQSVYDYCRQPGEVRVSQIRPMLVAISHMGPAALGAV